MFPLMYHGHPREDKQDFYYSAEVTGDNTHKHLTYIKDITDHRPRDQFYLVWNLFDHFAPPPPKHYPKKTMINSRDRSLPINIQRRDFCRSKRFFLSTKFDEKS